MPEWPHELCRKHGFIQKTFYKFKSRYGGMEVSEPVKLRAIIDRNARLKHLLAGTTPDNAGLKGLPRKN